MIYRPKYLGCIKTNMMQKPKGTMDYYNKSAESLKEFITFTEGIFIQNGGEYVETPVFEDRKMLMAKYGSDEVNKLIYDIAFEGGTELALRYDHTVPFMRFISEHGIKKIRRYTIGKVYRRDQPNNKQGRFREFYQADFDILGEASEEYSAELLILAMVRDILDYFGQEYKIYINFTEVLYDIVVTTVGVNTDKFATICSTIDKLDKVSFNDIIPELSQKGLSTEQITKLEGKLSGPYKFKDVEKFTELLKIYGLDNVVEFNTSLARGLGYYNGLIFEAKISTRSGESTTSTSTSVVAGGRYDGFVIDAPIIGLSVGITRLLSLLDYPTLKVEGKWKEEYYLTTVGKIDNFTKQKIINYCRKNICNNKPLLWSFEKDKKLVKVIGEKVKEYTKYLIIVYENELTQNQIIIKDLENKTQILVSIVI
jgi:histidyl-tRNA synthetase